MPADGAVRLSEHDGILYSQCWEDVACAREALRIQPGQTVLAIGAAGDNVLALLLDRPGRILAVDVSFDQCALAELKRAAAKILEPAEVAAFLGTEPDGRRLECYERIRASLPASAQDYWDRRRPMIARGVIHVGRFERYLSLFRRAVLPLVPGRKVVRAMLRATDLDEQRRIYRTAWDSRLWRGLFRAFFSRRVMAALGRHPALFAHAQLQNLGEHYLRRCRFALTELPIRMNPYLTFMLSGGYDLPAQTPSYLLPGELCRIRALVDRLEIANTSLADALASLPEQSVDAFYLSDVFELFDEGSFHGTLDQIVRVGRPGSRICYWNNLVERHRPERMANVLHSHDKLARELHLKDRAFLYSRFVVESVSGGA